eukprot:11700446-Alexandrium_andersonii.AAC.1
MRSSKLTEPEGILGGHGGCSRWSPMVGCGQVRESGRSPAIYFIAHPTKNFFVGSLKTAAITKPSVGYYCAMGYLSWARGFRLLAQEGCKSVPRSARSCSSSLCSETVGALHTPTVIARLRVSAQDKVAQRSHMVTFSARA